MTITRLVDEGNEFWMELASSEVSADIAFAHRIYSVFRESLYAETRQNGSAVVSKRSLAVRVRDIFASLPKTRIIGENLSDAKSILNLTRALRKQFLRIGALQENSRGAVFITAPFSVRFQEMPDAQIVICALPPERLALPASKTHVCGPVIYSAGGGVSDLPSSPKQQLSACFSELNVEEGVRRMRAVLDRSNDGAALSMWPECECLKPTPTGGRWLKTNQCLSELQGDLPDIILVRTEKSEYYGGFRRFGLLLMNQSGTPITGLSLDLDSARWARIVLNRRGVGASGVTVSFSGAYAQLNVPFRFPRYLQWIEDIGMQLPNLEKPHGGLFKYVYPRALGERIAIELG